MSAARRSAAAKGWAPPPRRAYAGGKLIRVRDPRWDGAFLTGRTVDTRQLVDEGEAGGAFVFAWLLEEDWDPDLDSGGFLQTMMQTV